jgi:hypothetical protein
LFAQIDKTKTRHGFQIFSFQQRHKEDTTRVQVLGKKKGVTSSVSNHLPKTKKTSPRVPSVSFFPPPTITITITIQQQQMRNNMDIFFPEKNGKSRPEKHTHTYGTRQEIRKKELIVFSSSRNFSANQPTTWH